jgi:hypothetical protein
MLSSSKVHYPPSSLNVLTVSIQLILSSIYFWVYQDVSYPEFIPFLFGTIFSSPLYMSRVPNTSPPPLRV